MKKLFSLLLIIVMAFSISLGGCMSQDDDKTVYVVSITSTGTSANNENVFKVSYSDGTYNYFTIKNGSNGEDGQDVSIDDIYQKYCDEVEEISYADFLTIYFGTTDIQIPEIDASKAIAKNVSSIMTIYATDYIASGTGYKTSIGAGTSVIYKIDSDYVYAITNYHVVYNNTSKRIAKFFNCYLYGSEDTPVITGTTDPKTGYEVINYGDYAVEFEYVGGSASHDLALIRASKEDVLSINPIISAVTFAKDYNVGQTAIAIGNMEGMGLSVTQGIISVYSEQVIFPPDGTTRYYTCLRFDGAIFHGNSGGGLFNAQGELIGITNGGHLNGQNKDGDDIGTSINYALPCYNVESVIDNIYYHANDGDDTTNGVRIPRLGVTVQAFNTKYVYDEELGYGRVTDDVKVTEVTVGGAVSEIFEVGDKLLSLTINSTEYKVNRYNDIGAILLKAKANDVLTFKFIRNDVEMQNSLTITALNIVSVD